MGYNNILLCVFFWGHFTVQGRSGLDKEQRNVLLQAHNYYRSLAAEDASNMERMVWNSQLENLAEQHVKKCHVVHNEDAHSSGLGFSTVGENQAVSTSLTLDYHLLVGKWYEEGKHYDIDTNMCAVEEDCNRYLQLIWATTTDFGCAIKKCQHAVPVVTLLVCHYGPGMIAGTLPYKRGIPCSACTSGHQSCRMNLCSTDAEVSDETASKKVHIPHFILVFPSKNTMLCYEVQATKGLAYNLISNERLEMTGYFMYYQNEGSAFVSLDTVSVKIKLEDGKLPNRIVLSGSKQEIKVDSAVLPIRSTQIVTIKEETIVSVPTKMVYHSDIFVKMEKLGLQFEVILTNDSQLQLIFSEVFSLFNEEPDNGLIGNFLHEYTRISEEENMLTLEGIDPIKIVQHTLENQPKASMNGQPCFFTVQSPTEDFESHYILRGL